MDTKKLRQKILDLAIHGKLVPQDPNDEPASVLLERIKAEKERLIKEGKIKRTKKSTKASDTPHYENVPFEVPEGWVWTTLEEICLFLSRGKSPKYSDIDKTYPVFAQKCNLKEGGISLEQARFLDPSTICKWSEEYKLKTGDVLVNSTGTGTVGRTRLFHESYLKNYPFVVPDSHISVIRTASETKSEFVFAYISSQLIQRHLENNLAGSTNQKELYIGVLADLLFPLPPLAEQQRIVLEIEKWFTLIDQIEQGKVDLQTVIKQTKNKILDLAIHGKLVPQDPNDKPASELLKRINPKAEITCDNGHSEKLPQGWYSATINDVCSIIGGVSYNKADIQDTGIRVLRGGNIQSGKVFYCSDDVFIPFSYQNKENQVQYGDIIVVASTGSQTLIGKTGFVDRDIPKTQIGAFLRIVRPKQKTLSPYIRLLFQTDAYKDYIRNVAKGSNINNVKNAHLQNYQICLPPLAEQQRIVTKIEELFSVLDNIQNALEA